MISTKLTRDHMKVLKYTTVSNPCSMSVSNRLVRLNYVDDHVLLRIIKSLFGTAARYGMSVVHRIGFSPHGQLVEALSPCDARSYSLMIANVATAEFE